MQSFDNDRLIRIILALYNEIDLLKSEIEKLKAMKKGGAFKFDPSIKYSLRESHTIFVQLLEILRENESKNGPSKSQKSE